MIHEGTSRRLPTLARRLVEYWLENPGARDTVEGIHKWWLSQELQGTTRDDLRKALEGLHRRGWVREQNSRAGVVTYGIDLERRSEIEDYLKRMD